MLQNYSRMAWVLSVRGMVQNSVYKKQLTVFKNHTY